MRNDVALDRRSWHWLFLGSVLLMLFGWGGRVSAEPPQRQAPSDSKKTTPSKDSTPKESHSTKPLTRRKRTSKAAKTPSAPPVPPLQEFWRRTPFQKRDPARELNDILKRPEFAREKDNVKANSWVRRVADWIRRLRERFLSWLKSNKKKPKKEMPRKPKKSWLWDNIVSFFSFLRPVFRFLYAVLNSPILWGVLGGIALVWLGRHLWRWWEQRERPEEETSAWVESEEEPEEPDLLEQDPDLLWSDAETLAAQGRHREAVRHLYRGLLLQMHRRELLAYEPNATNWEYLRMLGRSHRAYKSFQSFVRQFEYAWYGMYPCGSEEFLQCKTLASSILASTVSTPAPEGELV